jgi:hypothetical protein
VVEGRVEGLGVHVELHVVAPIPIRPAKTHFYNQHTETHGTKVEVLTQPYVGAPGDVPLCFRFHVATCDYHMFAFALTSILYTKNPPATREQGDRKPIK